LSEILNNSEKRKELLKQVKFFSLGPDRIFTRNREILGRDVRMCHPSSSVNIVEQILNDFRNGKQNSAFFWINTQGKKF
jgi:DUF438 domain-containing protein